MGSKLDQDPSSDFFQEDLTSSICIILQTNRQSDKQTYGHENNTSLVEVMIIEAHPIFKTD